MGRTDYQCIRKYSAEDDLIFYLLFLFFIILK